jgi:hypothetical protein
VLAAFSLATEAASLAAVPQALPKDVMAEALALGAASLAAVPQALPEDLLPKALQEDKRPRLALWQKDHNHHLRPRPHLVAVAAMMRPAHRQQRCHQVAARAVSLALASSELWHVLVLQLCSQVPPWAEAPWLAAERL